MKNNNPVIVIYFSDQKNQGAKINNPKYFRSYQDLCAKLAKNNFDIYIVKGKKHRFLGKMIFQSASKFQKDKLISVNKPIKADLILLRTGVWLQDEKPKNVLNKFELIKICHNKLKTYQLLKKYMPKTYAINKANFLSVMDKITTGKVVIKPIDGNSGTDVYAVDKTKITSKIMQVINTRDCIVQEFVDTKKGITDIVKGYHDLRIINFSGKLCLSYLRIPGKSLISNLDRLGKERIISINKIPKIAKDLCRTIDKKFVKFGARIYSIDMGFENGIPKIFELNSTPGMPFYEYNQHNKYYDRFHNQIVSTIKLALKQI